MKSVLFGTHFNRETQIPIVHLKTNQWKFNLFHSDGSRSARLTLFHRRSYGSTSFLGRVGLGRFQIPWFCLGPVPICFQSTSEAKESAFVVVNVLRSWELLCFLFLYRYCFVLFVCFQVLLPDSLFCSLDTGGFVLLFKDWWFWILSFLVVWL
jgi:hypothetical protein